MAAGTLPARRFRIGVYNRRLAVRTPSPRCRPDARFSTVNYGMRNNTFSPNTQGINTNANFGRSVSAQKARRMLLGVSLTFQRKRAYLERQS